MVLAHGRQSRLRQGLQRARLVQRICWLWCRHHLNRRARRPSLQFGLQVFSARSAQQIAQRTGGDFAFGGEVLAAIHHAQKQGPLCAGQGHIQEALVFGQALGVAAQRLLFFFFEVRGKRHIHPRKLQALGLVHGDDLHQIGIGFQAHLRGVATGLRVVQLVGQVTQQGALPLQIQADFLQQVTQMQQIGQAALWVHGAGGQALGNVLLMQPLVEHGQKALALPGLLPTAKALHLRVPSGFVLQQMFDLG